jgi:type I restriction enzyme, R subunit
MQQSADPEPGLKFDKIYEVFSQRFRRDDFEDEKFDPKVLPASYLLDPHKGHAFVYVCTIQHMAINLFGREVALPLGDETPDDEAARLDIPIHAFDVVIADECHHGYTTAELSVWRSTLDHFDAIKIGLTATPAAHTKAYFNDDMMSTGIDIPDLEFIVFLRPVNSRILFEQMLGRGTRKGEKHPDKSHFTVFDCFDGTLLAYFKKASAFTADPPERPSRTIQEIIEDIWQNRDRAYNVRCLVKRLQRIDKEMSGEARELFVAYVPGGDLSQFARDLPRRIAEDFTGMMKLLRDPGFQDLLVNYPRPKRTFVVAYETEDDVSSQWLIRDGSGHEYKPEDYIEAFARFVRENADQVDAIGILLDRPQGWGTDALTELRQKLVAAREHFTLENLQKAHLARYHKALVEIISMVKHAADEEEPLLTAEERVDRALAQISAGHELSQEQHRWLDRLRAPLIESLSISRDDFDLIPIFTREGGWRPADDAFGGKLDEWLCKMNEAIAA